MKKVVCRWRCFTSYCCTKVKNPSGPSKLNFCSLEKIIVFHWLGQCIYFLQIPVGQPYGVLSTSAFLWFLKSNLLLQTRYVDKAFSIISRRIISARKDRLNFLDFLTPPRLEYTILSIKLLQLSFRNKFASILPPSSELLWIISHFTVSKKRQSKKGFKTNIDSSV